MAVFVSAPPADRGASAAVRPDQAHTDAPILGRVRALERSRNSVYPARECLVGEVEHELRVFVQVLDRRARRLRSQRPAWKPRAVRRFQASGASTEYVATDGPAVLVRSAQGAHESSAGGTALSYCSVGREGHGRSSELGVSNPGRHTPDSAWQFDSRLGVKRPGVGLAVVGLELFEALVGVLDGLHDLGA